MGLLMDKLGHSRFKEILKWGKELAVIAIFIWMALNMRAEWQAGYEQCQKEGEWNAKYNFSTTGGYNNSTNSTFPLNITSVSQGSPHHLWVG